MYEKVIFSNSNLVFAINIINEEYDELASFWIQYADKFILGVNDNQVTLRKYSIGDIELIIMPEMI